MGNLPVEGELGFKFFANGYPVSFCDFQEGTICTQRNIVGLS